MPRISPHFSLSGPPDLQIHLHVHPPPLVGLAGTPDSVCPTLPSAPSHFLISPSGTSCPSSSTAKTRGSLFIPVSLTADPTLSRCQWGTLPNIPGARQPRLPTSSFVACSRPPQVTPGFQPPSRVPGSQPCPLGSPPQAPLNPPESIRHQAGSRKPPARIWPCPLSSSPCPQ